MEAAVERIHRSADHGPVFTLHAVLDRNKGLCIFGGDAEDAGQPHPEDGSGTAEGDGRSDADDVAGADGRGKSGRQRTELRDVAFCIGVFLKGHFNRLEDVFLDETCPDCHVDVCSEQHDDERPSPKEIIDRTDDRRKVHMFSP